MLGISFQTNHPLNTYGPLAAQVESYGFAAIALFNDMLYQPAWLPLLEMARHTQQIHLGPIAVNPFTCHPINIAGHLALLGEAAPKRIYLGLARGAWLDYVGLQPKRPLKALPEALACIRHLLNRNHDPLPGDIFSLAGGESLQWDIPAPNIPFLLATWGPKTVRACIKHISEVKLGGVASPSTVAWMRGVIDQAALKVGRDPSEISIIVGSTTAIDEDGAAALEVARLELAQFLGIIANLDPTLKIDPNTVSDIKKAASQYNFKKAASFISDDLVRHFAFAGTPKEIISQTEALLDAGAARIDFAPPYGLNTKKGIQLLGEQVVTQFKEN